MIAEAVERVFGDRPDELGVLALRRDASRLEVVVASEDLTDEDFVVTAETALYEVAKQFCGVVSRVCSPSVHSLRSFPDEHPLAPLADTPPFQLDGDESAVVRSHHVHGRPPDAVLGLPVEARTPLSESVPESVAHGLGELAHELGELGGGTSTFRPAGAELGSA